MNRKQKIALWIGIIVIILLGLFPPFVEPVGMYGRGRYYKFILFSDDNIDIIKLCVQWAIVAVITGGLIITFKDKKQIRNPQYEAEG